MNISGALQENLLVLLCFDSKNCPVLANSLDIELFESSVYREIASQATNYYHEFKKPIGEHLPDVLEHIIEGKDKRKAELYKDVLGNLYDFQENVNAEYVMGNFSKFVRMQNLKIGVKDALQHLEKDRINEAELALDRYKKADIGLFDPGTFLKDPQKSLKFLTSTSEVFHMGIPPLDSLGICPAPKELFTFVSLPNMGKTWFLCHVGKYSILQRRKVLHVTLEMSEEKISMRYMQNLFGVSKREAKKDTPIFVTDDRGKLEDIDFENPGTTLTLEDPEILKKLSTKLERMRCPNLVIKEFPTGQLSINQLKAYLESLQTHYNFFPDILIVDYADLMDIDSRNLRIDTGRLYKDLRGLAVEYNIGVVTASQANRGGEEVKLLTPKHFAEDYSKFAISDNILTFNQTKDEYKKNLARLFVGKGRGDRKGDIVLISQNYDMGQFCLDSLRINDNYWKILEEYEED